MHSVDVKLQLRHWGVTHKALPPGASAMSSAVGQAPRLQRLVDLDCDAVVVAARDELALRQLQGAATLRHCRICLALAVHQIHTQQRRQVHLRVQKLPKLGTMQGTGS